MRVPHAAKGQRQHFPIFTLFLVNFGHCKFRDGLISPDHGHKGNAVPDDGRFSRNFYGRIMDFSFLVPNASGFDDLELLGFFPGAAHVDKLCFVVKKWFKFVHIFVGHPLPFVFGELDDFLFLGGGLGNS